MAKCAKDSNLVSVPALAGYGAGEHGLSDGRRIVVGTGPWLVEAVDGEWGTIRGLIEGVLKDEDGDDGEQRVYFHAWCKVAYEALLFREPGEFLPGHALVLAGPAASGKSLLQREVITRLLGGRAADPTAHLMKDPLFNADIIGAEHLMMEDVPVGARSRAGRERLAEGIKRVVCEESRRLLRRGEEPVMVRPFWRLSISMNDDSDVLRKFPALTADLRGKVVMLLTRCGPLLMATGTPGEWAAFRARIEAEMPAYAHWLRHEFVIPRALVSGPGAARFGFAARQHPRLGEVLWA